MIPYNEAPFSTPILCIQMRKTSCYGSILQRRSLLMDGQNEDSDIKALVSTTSNTSSDSGSTTNACAGECSTRIGSIDEVYDQLDALTMQDINSYIIRDYIGRRSIRHQQQALKKGDEDYHEGTESEDCNDYDLFPTSCTSRETPIASYANQVDENVDESLLDVDESCREKMCEWSYRICDHFNTSREIVAIAFSYLDRFNDVTRCDRTAFKLASMTCLYIATKVFHNKQLSVLSLVELSRNEFTAQHIIQMERIILATLDYKMNPPTAQIFLYQYQLILPIKQILAIADCDSFASSENDLHTEMYSKIMNNIYDRAIYYGELVVYDYILVTEQRHVVALSCLFNAIYDVILNDKNEDDSEYYERRERYEEFQKDFIEQLQNSVTSCLGSINIERIYEFQERLWYIYSCSADYHQNQQYQQYFKINNITYGCNSRGFCSLNSTDGHTNEKEGNDEALSLTSVSPISTLPNRVTGLQSDKFSVRIF